MWINGYNSNQFVALYFQSFGGGTHNLMGNLYSAFAYSGPSDRTIGNYASLADARTAVSSIIGTAGFPWLIVGDLSTASDGQLVALNFKNLLQFEDGLTGISLGGDITNGYAPWANYADARAGILALVGNLAV